MRVVVIGAGLGGLAAAANLVRRGHDVTVLERESVPGGRAGVLADSGFHIDTGPTMITMPELLRTTFAAAGADIDRYVKITPLDPMYRATFADGSVLYARHDREEMVAEIRSFAGAHDAAAFGEFTAWLDEMFAIVTPSFVEGEFHSTPKLAQRWRPVSQMIRKGGFKRLDTKLASFFEDARLQRLFGFHSLQAGLAPHDALAVFALRTFVDGISGVFRAEGGMHAVVTGLARAVTDAGATIRYDTPVTRILRGGNNAVTGVEVGGSVRLVADAVVCNSDLPVAYRTLLGGVDAPRVARRGRYAPSCLLWVAVVRADGPRGRSRPWRGPANRKLRPEACFDGAHNRPRATSILGGRPRVGSCLRGQVLARLEASPRRGFHSTRSRAPVRVRLGLVAEHSWQERRAGRRAASSLSPTFVIVLALGASSSSNPKENIGICEALLPGKCRRLGV